MSKFFPACFILLILGPAAAIQAQEFCDGVCDEGDWGDLEGDCYFQDCLLEENGEAPSQNRRRPVFGENGPMSRDFSHDRQEKITVRRTGSKYKVTASRPSGWFQTGQKADIVLSALGFNETGGPLLFNHPMGVASDDRRLLLADTYNNRVLVWNKLPRGNVPPDLVLGQKDFHGNDSGEGRDQMNWPVSVATDGERIVVADTENHRVLIWKHWPEKNAAPADLVMQGATPWSVLQPSKTRFVWPWGVWTDGKKLIVVSTRGGWILIWNDFPTSENMAADIILTGLGTPRQITSDGRSLIVGDHNAKPGLHASGSWFWKKFPAHDDDKPDFFMQDTHGGTWFRGQFLKDGRLALLANSLNFWNSLPENEHSRPHFAIHGFEWRGGDHVTVAEAGGMLYICAGNRNQVLVYRSLPDSPEDYPDFAIGSPDIQTDTLQTNFIMSNPVPASNGVSLFVASDFDRKFYVWKSLPDESGAHPDFVYDMPVGAWDAALWRDRLVLAGKDAVFAWNKLPVNGEIPDLILRGTIGGVRFSDIKGVALDDRYFYLSDSGANKVYVWDKIPSQDQKPLFELPAERPGRLTSDGRFFAVAPLVGPMIEIYDTDKFSARSKPRLIGPPASHLSGGRGMKSMFNLATCAEMANGHLFIAEAGGGKVHAWRRIEDAFEGRRADIILGAGDFEEIAQETAQDKMRYPAALSFDGSYLWVGETKFSERLLRFSVY
ncbi:MAG: hypothetical protein HY547_05440 [Elusimicrobia bacterium]|nr:hypothetical protein [Elusimicrobiota bacterium]